MPPLLRNSQSVLFAGCMLYIYIYIYIYITLHSPTALSQTDLRQEEVLVVLEGKHLLLSFVLL